MPKITDEELEKLFRDAAERVTPEFDQGDWDDMSRKLERAELAAKARNRTLYSMVTILVLYSLWSPFGEKYNTQRASMMQPLATTELSVKEVAPDAPSEASAPATNPNGAKLKSVELQKGKNEAVVTNDAPSAAEAAGNKTSSNDRVETDAVRKSFAESKPQQGSKSYVLQTPNSSAKENQQRSITSDVNTKITRKLENESANVDSKLIVIADDVNRNPGVHDTSEPAIVNDDRSLKRNASITPGISTLNGEQFAVPVGSDAPRSSDEEGKTRPLNLYTNPSDRKLPSIYAADVAGGKDAKHVISPLNLEALDSAMGEIVVKKDMISGKHTWYLKLPVSPDFSSIDYGKAGKTGVNIGLLGEFSITNHFTVSTGAIWSKKLYDQENPDKTYTSGSWTAKAKSLSGDCRVLDIPINVTYYLFPERKTSFFVTVGSSSYIMLKEDYEFTVWKNPNYVTYDEKFAHKNNEWFSMLNVSIGIQQHIGQRFMVQAEPFLKAPISGVGEGKINLVSTGVFVALKYRLTK